MKTVKKNGGTVTDMPTNPALVQPNPNLVAVKPEDQKIVREFDQELAKQKMELANLTVQIELMKNKRREVVQKLVDVDKQYFERISKIAAEYGLDMQQTKWNFDAAKMAFSKME